jgi:hypothetical protein
VFCSVYLLRSPHETLQNIQSKKQIRINSSAFIKYFVTKLVRYTKNAFPRLNWQSTSRVGWTSLSVVRQFIPPRFKKEMVLVKRPVSQAHSPRLRTRCSTRTPFCWRGSTTARLQLKAPNFSRFGNWKRWARNVFCEWLITRQLYAGLTNETYIILL